MEFAFTHYQGHDRWHATDIKSFFQKHRYIVVSGCPYPSYGVPELQHPCVWVEYLYAKKCNSNQLETDLRPLYPYFDLGEAQLICAPFVVRALLDALAPIPEVVEIPPGPAAALCGGRCTRSRAAIGRPWPWLQLPGLQPGFYVLYGQHSFDRRYGMNFVFEHHHSGKYSTWTAPEVNGHKQHIYTILHGCPYPKYTTAFKLVEPCVWVEYRAPAYTSRKLEDRPLYPYARLGWANNICGIFVVRHLLSALAPIVTMGKDPQRHRLNGVTDAVEGVMGLLGYITSGPGFVAGHTAPRTCSVINTNSISQGHKPKDRYGLPIRS